MRCYDVCAYMMMMMKTLTRFSQKNLSVTRNRSLILAEEEACAATAAAYNYSTSRRVQGLGEAKTTHCLTSASMVSFVTLKTSRSRTVHRS